MRTVAVVLYALLVVAPATAQNSKVVAPYQGASLRMRLYGRPEIFEGSFSALSKDTLWYWSQGSSGTPSAISLGIVSELNSKTGTKRHPLEGALTGGALMAMTAVMFNAAFGPILDAECSYVNDSSCQNFRTSVVVTSTLVGAAFGAGIGALIKSDKWLPALSARESHTIVPSKALADGLGAGATDAVGYREGTTKWFMYGFAGGSLGSVMGALIVDKKVAHSHVAVAGTQNDTTGTRNTEYVIGYSQAYTHSVRSKRLKYERIGSAAGIVVGTILNATVSKNQSSY